MKHLSILISLFVVYILTACVQVSSVPKTNKKQLAITSVWDRPAEFPKGSTFSLSPRHVEKVSLSPEQEKTAYDLYKSALINSLEQYGYVFVEEPELAKFYVGYGVALSKDLDDKKISEKFGVTPGLQAKAGDEKGSFLVYVEDAITAERLWRGAVQGVVQEDNDKATRKTRAVKVVNTVLQHFYNGN